MMATRSIETDLPDVSQMFTALLSDVLDRNGYPSQLVDPSIRPITPCMRLFGRARTFKVISVDAPPDKPYGILLRGLSQASPGDLFVASLENGGSSGFFGGLLATACRAVGVRGAVVDGPVRDVAELTALDFPTFATGINAADSYGRDEAVEVDVPVTLGGVPVRPGDYIFGDVDGLVVLPLEISGAILNAANEKLGKEGDMKRALADGMPLDIAFEKFKVL